jgi:hypothetical protein
MTNDQNDIAPEFYELVGRIASDWAFLEMMVNDCIWALSGSSYGAGACVTAQIYSFDAKMKAMIALLRLRGREDLAKKANSFLDTSRSSLTKRNRAIHDPWYLGEESATQLSITADKRLIFDTVEKTLDQLKSDHAAVEKTVIDFFDIHEEIRDVLPSLRDTQPLALRATYRTLNQK